MPKYLRVHDSLGSCTVMYTELFWHNNAMRTKHASALHIIQGTVSILYG